MQLFFDENDRRKGLSFSADALGKNKRFFTFGLVVFTFISYIRVINNEFISYDDLQNIDLIRDLTKESLFGVFSPVFVPYWDPVTRLLYYFNLSLAGESPFIFHLTSMLLHILNVILLFDILVSLNIRYLSASFIALLFAVHPINVETVAWVSAVNNQLSTYFMMLSVIAYIKYLNNNTAFAYIQLVLLMILGLLAKPSAVILPVILIFIDLSFFGKFDWYLEDKKVQILKNLIFNKLPLFFLSIVYVLLTLGFTKSNLLTNYIFIGEFETTIFYRIENALISYVVYIGKMLWPAEFSIFYPPQSSYPAWQVISAGFILISLTIIAILQSKKRPWIVFGWSWYLITLFPSIGIFRQGVWPEYADRYAYVPFIGLYVIVAFSAQELLVKGRITKFLLGTLASIAVFLLIVITNKQVSVWNNSISLFENAVAVNSNNILAYTLLGDAYYLKADYDNAHRVDQLSKKLNPLLVNYGLTRAVGSFYKKRYTQALTRFQRLYFMEPGNLDVIYYLALTHKNLNNYEMAIRYFNQYLENAVSSGYKGNQYLDEVRKEIDGLKAKRINKTD